MISNGILYSDSNVVVYNKPAGIPSHPLRESETDTALHRVVAYFPEVAFASENPREGGLCHRLDTDTSGALLFARNRDTHECYRQAFSEGRLLKRYLALIFGRLLAPLYLAQPVAHHQKNSRKMVVVEGAKYFRGKPQTATTEVTPIECFQDATLVAIRLTGPGRRHQIRVHLAFAKHPLVGDLLYNGPPPHYLSGHALHASRIQLLNGITVEAPEPQAFFEEVAFWRNKT